MNKFKAELTLPEVYSCMQDYYVSIDASEDARVDVEAGYRWNELKDKQ